MKMKKLSILCVLLGGLFGLSTSFSADFSATCPENVALFCLKQQLIQYFNTGKYERDLAQVDHQAKEFIKERIAHAKPNEKLALVLDIDDTSLSNFQDMELMSFGGTKDEIISAIAKGKDPEIKPTLELFRYAKSKNMAVFFITGRPETMREITEKNLKAAGYRDWDGLIFRPNDYASKSIIPYKSGSRRALSKNGYVIVANVGDQMSDLSGGFSEKTFKLPNPFYYLP